MSKYRSTALSCAAVAIVALIVSSLTFDPDASQAQTRSQSQQRGGSGSGRGGGGGSGGGNGFQGFGSGGGSGFPGFGGGPSAAIAADGKYVFVVHDGVLLQFNAHDLSPGASVALDGPAAKKKRTLR